MPGQSCSSLLKRVERCCDGTRRGPAKCVFNGTVSAFDGTRYGVCCIKDDYIGCAVDSDCCSSNYRCDDIGFCRAVPVMVSNGMNVAGSLAKSLRNDREMELMNDVVMGDEDKKREIVHDWLLLRVGLFLMISIVATACCVGMCLRKNGEQKMKMVAVKQDSDDELADDENEWNSMLRWAMKKKNVVK